LRGERLTIHLNHPLKAIANAVFCPSRRALILLLLCRKRGADQLFFVTNEDMLICIRRRRPDHFPAGKGVSPINDVKTAEFLIDAGCETGADEVALIGSRIWLERCVCRCY
jgi:hypothetical protein